MRRMSVNVQSGRRYQSGAGDPVGKWRSVRCRPTQRYHLAFHCNMQSAAALTVELAWRYRSDQRAQAPACSSCRELTCACRAAESGIGSIRRADFAMRARYTGSAIAALVMIARHDGEASLGRVRLSLLQPAAGHEQFLGDVQAMMPVRALQWSGAAPASRSPTWPDADG